MRFVKAAAMDEGGVWILEKSMGSALRPGALTRPRSRPTRQAKSCNGRQSSMRNTSYVGRHAKGSGNKDALWVGGDHGGGGWGGASPVAEDEAEKESHGMLVSFCVWRV